MDLAVWQWLLLAVGAFVTGLSKTGIAGVAVLAVAFFANALPARASTGALLPLLICGDVFGVAMFRKHAHWPRLWLLFPWVVPGVVAGYFALEHVNNVAVQRMIGWILLSMVVLHLWRRRQTSAALEHVPHSWWFAGIMGMLAGFTTMVANAAGPVMALYLLAVGLEKMAFVGTAAWFFMCINLFKVPFSLHLGLITPHSLLLDAVLLVPMLPGLFLGPVILKRLEQRWFENLALGLAAVSAVKLVL